MRLADRYVPALDGVRACSALAVIAYHVFEQTPRSYGFAGGFQGVEVFFVLSGYLITSSLLSEHSQSGAIDFLAFYVRRALRLLPALLLATAGATLLAGLLAPTAPGFGLALGLGALFALTYTTDLAATFGASTAWLGHTWSLAVEEQYYLVWPVILAVLARRRRKFSLIFLAVAALGFVAGTAAAFRIIGHSNAFAPWTHAFALVLGSALAVALRQPVPPLLERLAGIGWLGALPLLWWLFRPPSAHTLSYGGWSAIALLSGAVMLHLLLREEALFSRILSCTPLVWIGRRSYGLYLYSLPIGLALQQADAGVAVTGTLTVLLSVVAAALSYRFAEEPALKRKRRPDPQPANCCTRCTKAAPRAR